VLDRQWRSVEGDHSLQLAPGKHSVRYGWAGYQQKPGDATGIDKTRPVLLWSAPVEITIGLVLPGSRLSVNRVIKEKAAFAAVCEAVGEPAESAETTAPGVSPLRQMFKVVEVLFGKVQPVDRIPLAYRIHDKPERGERAVLNHERVIWIGHTRNMSSHGSLYGLKALPDTPENRRAVTAEAARARPVAPEATPRRQAEKRAAHLEAHIASFHMDLTYYGKISEGGERPSNRLILHVKPTRWKLPLPADLWAVQITKEQARKIVDHLATEGFLDKARGSGRNTVSYRRPGYVLWVKTEGLNLYESLGWDLPMLHRLEGLRKVLDGDAARAMDKLLATLEPRREQLEAADAGPRGSRLHLCAAARLLISLRFPLSSKLRTAKYSLLPAGTPLTVNRSALPGSPGAGSPRQFAPRHQFRLFPLSRAQSQPS
jgi:hypothetical protein